MLVKPAPGLVFRDPETKLRVPDEGLQVPDNDPLWNRMIDNGDAVKVIADSAKPTKGEAQ